MAQRPPLRGYNHNIRYKVRVYHVQTEDSGLDNPHVTTHLFLDGLIVSTQRKSYVRLIGEPDADEQVRRMMQEQHKGIMKQLRCGQLDGRITALAGTLRPGTEQAEPSITPPEGYAPPSVDGMTPTEERAVKRGTRISRVITPLTRQPSGEIPIPLDHPAFSAIPMLEWDETAGGDALELDLEAINELDLDASTRTVPRPQTGGGVGEELDLDALLADADDDAAMAVLMAPLPDAPSPQPLSEPAALEWEPAVSSVVVKKETEQEVVRKRQPAHASLPLPVVHDEVDESLFEAMPDVPDEIEGQELDRKTLTFPAPFKSPPQVEQEPAPRPTQPHKKSK